MFGFKAHRLLMISIFFMFNFCLFVCKKFCKIEKYNFDNFHKRVNFVKLDVGKSLNLTAL